MIFALANGIASVAKDDKAIRCSRVKPNRQRSVLKGVSWAGADHAIAARNVTSKRARSRTHIGCVHVEFLQEIY
jgi:hypothetical protein